MQVVDSEGYLKVKLVGGPVGPFVPYTGATANVDLGEYEIKAGQLELDQTPTGTAGVAVMRWNDQDGTADLGLKGGNVTLQVGQEQVTRVVNKTGVNLLEANYQAVRVDGAQGNRLKVALAQANNDANSADTLGLVTETINDNQEGFVTVSGLVRNINTTGSIQTETWLDGDVLYLSGTVAGQITNVKPAAPIHTVIMGYVVRAHATQGQIYVKVDNGYELDELHNVAIVTPLNDQVLQYETATSLWKNKTISSGITIGTTAITSGTVGRVLFEGTGNVVQESANLFWDETNSRLSIGANSPTSKLFVRADGASGLTQPFRVETSASRLLLQTEDGGTTRIGGPTARLYVNVESGGLTHRLVVNGSVHFGNGIGNAGANLFDSAGTSSASRILQYDGSGSPKNLITANGASYIQGGNVLINTTTDAGYRLDVNGTARVQNTLTVTKGAGNFFTFEAAANGSDLSIRFFKAGAFDVSLSTRNATNIGSQSIVDGLGLNGGFLATRLGASLGVIAVTNTGGDSQFHAASQNGFSSYVSFRETGVADRGILGFQNGTSYLQIRTNGATNMSNGTFSTAFFSTGNVGINTTTDAGYKLDVNGTARVSGDLTVSQLRLSANALIGFNGVRIRGAAAASIGGTSIGNLATPQTNVQLYVLGYGDTSATNSLLIRNSSLQNALQIRDDRVIIMEGVPTSSAGLPTGAIWNDAGTLKIV
jgi:hypothetical protein